MVWAKLNAETRTRTFKGSVHTIFRMETSYRQLLRSEMVSVGPIQSWANHIAGSLPGLAHHAGREKHINAEVCRKMG